MAPLRLTYARERDTKAYVRFIPPDSADVVGAVLVKKTNPLSAAASLVVELSAGE